MNVVLVLIDSLNRDMLGAYGGSWVETPNLDRFARRARRFDEHRVGSLPCIPARRELLAGRQEFLWRPWGPLEEFDEPLPCRLEARGYATGIVTDHYHYWDGDADGYLQTFASIELIRGHELDPWRSQLPTDTELPRWVRNIERDLPGWGTRYYTNVRDFADESDFFPARVFTAATDWLKRRDRARPFFLQVESFDVHEPFHVPEPYASMYGPPPDASDYTIWPPYHSVEQQNRWLAHLGADAEDAFRFARAQYAGKLTMLDRWFGELLGVLDRDALWHDTTVIVTTDHGHDLGERRRFGKQFPHHDSHARIPLLIAHPDLPGEHQPVRALTTTVDLYATIAELAGADVTSPHSGSLVDLMRGEPGGRDALLYGSFGQGLCATDGDWTIMLPTDTTNPIYAYTGGLWPLRHRAHAHGQARVESGHFIPGVELPQWRIPIDHYTRGLRHDDQPALYHIADDPAQTRNRYDDAREQRERMRALTCRLMDEIGASPEHHQSHGTRRQG